MTTTRPATAQASLRDRCALIIITLVITVPVAMTTRRYNSFDYYAIISTLQLAFAACYASQTRAQIATWYRESKLFKALALCTMLLIAGWERHWVDWTSPRSFFYLTQPFFLAACVVWFTRHSATGLRHIFLLKLATTFTTALILLGAAWLATDDAARLLIKASPPIYWHLRHLNYDAAFAVGLAWAFLASSNRPWQRNRLHLLALLAFGFISVWSAARGQLLATAIFILVFAISTDLRSVRRSLLAGFLAFLLGAATVFLSGETYFVDQTANYSSLSNSVDKISATRLTIWKKSLEAMSNYWIFGLGPDGLLGPLSHFRIAQPHNFIVQWLGEFGVIGTAAIFLTLALLCKKCVNILHSGQYSAITSGTAALLLSIPFYALVDGLFYHAAPIIMFMLLTGFLLANPQKAHASAAKNSGDLSRSV